MDRRFPFLVTLNCGLGRDSIAMLCLLAEHQLVMEGQHIGPADVDAVIFADTGAEWPHTYALLPVVADFCAAMGVRFIHIAKPPEYGERGWRDNPRAHGDREDPAWVVGSEEWTIAERAASGAYHRRIPIIPEFSRYGKIAVTVNASCTDNHKVQPIRRVMADLCLERFGVDCRSWGHLVRRGLRERHRVLIGIAADEADRAINTGRPFYEWAVYPLLEAGLTKPAETAILARHGFDMDLPIYKSGCVMCPFQPIGWFWALSVLHPDLFEVVVEYEAAALAKNPAMHLIGGRKGQPIRLAVAAWRARNRHATIEGVLRKAYQRGCQITHVAQGELLTPADPPRRHYLVAQLQKALAVGVADPNVYAQLSAALAAAGLHVASEQARDAAALARIAAARPAATVEAPAVQLELGGAA